MCDLYLMLSHEEIQLNLQRRFRKSDERGFFGDERGFFWRVLAEMCLIKTCRPGLNTKVAAISSA